MDPLSFGLVIAQEVLGGVITDFFVGKRRSASKREIETMVVEVMRKQQAEMAREQADIVVRYALEELRYMVNEHPDVEWRINKVRPLLAPEQEERVKQNQMLAARMRQLDQIVASRRKVLGLSMTSDHSDEPLKKKPDGSKEAPLVAHDAPFETEKVDLPTEDKYWQRRMEQTKERIAEKRTRMDAPEDDGA
ncbi:MAG TPA: hypothetical protein VKJ45_11755 [Blastocatellia bacterium]|nr:hypothetical protein [Blastocatellia bacterium]